MESSANQFAGDARFIGVPSGFHPDDPHPYHPVNHLNPVIPFSSAFSQLAALPRAFRRADAQASAPSSCAAARRAASIKKVSLSTSFAATAAAMETAEHRMSGEFEFGGQEHFYLETQAAWAEAGGDGDVFISSSTQHPSEIQIIVAKVLGLPRHRVVVEAPRMGGGFGGKETQGNGWAALAAIAALKTGKPVRIQLDRDLDMMLNGKRHPFYARFEVGFDSYARLTAADISLYSDGGWALDLSMPIMDRAMFHLDNAYYIPAVRFTGQVVRTNTVSNTAFRGFGGPQGMLVIEEIIARIASATGLPAEVVRERNLYHGTGETNTTHYGQEIEDNR
ncbi:MAG: molybdopterin cofactor-binding domain-containing protein, partial [Chthoniobacterales bacterium]